MSERRGTFDDEAVTDDRTDRGESPFLEASIQDTLFGVVPEPRPTSWYRENGRRNMTTGNRQSTEAETLADGIESVDAVERSGVVFACPSGLGVRWRRTDDGFRVRLSSTFEGGFRRYKRGGASPDDRRLDCPMVEVNSMWVPNVPAGYSLLLLPQPTLDDRRFEVVPRLLDADAHPGTVKIPIRTLESPIEFEPGAQLACAIPVHRGRCAMDGRIEPTRNAEADATLTGEQLLFSWNESPVETPPDPEPAHSAVRRRLDGGDERRGSLVPADIDISIRDALELGWFVRSPVTAEVSVPEDEAERPRLLDANPSALPDVMNPLETVSDTCANAYARLKTGWNVALPPSHDVLVLSTFLQPDSGFTVVSERFSPETDADSHVVSLDPLVRIDEATFDIERGQPIARVVPIRRESLGERVYPDTLSDRQSTQLKRYEASMQRTDYYADEVREAHPTPTVVSATGTE